MDYRLTKGSFWEAGPNSDKKCHIRYWDVIAREKGYFIQHGIEFYILRSESEINGK